MNHRSLNELLWYVSEEFKLTPLCIRWIDGNFSEILEELKGTLLNCFWGVEGNFSFLGSVILARDNERLSSKAHNSNIWSGHRYVSFPGLVSACLHFLCVLEFKLQILYCCSKLQWDLSSYPSLDFFLFLCSPKSISRTITLYITLFQKFTIIFFT